MKTIIHRVLLALAIAGCGEPSSVDVDAATGTVTQEVTINGGDFAGADLMPGDGDVLSGTFTNVGTFRIVAGITVFVAPGVTLDVTAAATIIDGTLDGNGAGFAGGGPTPPAPLGIDGNNGSGPGAGIRGKVGACVHGGGGGGAGHGGVGGSGGYFSNDGGDIYPNGGVVYGSTVDFLVEPGSGGGSGGSGCEGNNFAGGPGGAGGGAIRIQSNNIDITGLVRANGAPGVQAPTGSGGGGGSGGGIALLSSILTGTGSVTAIGGAGGRETGFGLEGDGGGGGGGTIKLLSSAPFSTAVAGGAAGGPCNPNTLFCPSAAAPGRLIVLAPVLAPNPTSVPFGNVRVGQTSGSQNVTLKNAGGLDLTITAISTTAPFAVGNLPTLPITLGPNADVVISTTFSPAALGPATGSISVTSNDATSPTAIGLSGTGVAPAIGFDQASINFGGQRINTTGNRNLQITNTGSDTLTITSLSATGAFTVPGGPIVLAPAASQTISVSFTPTAAAPFTGTLTVVSDAGTSPDTVSLAGVGVEPLIQAPPSVAFGNQRVNTTGNTTVQVTNTGSDTLTISAISTSGAFSQGNATPIVIAPGNNATLNVSFTPTGLGPFTGNLTITSNAASSPTVVGLSGTGVAPQISVQPSLAFGNQRINTTGNQPLLVLNTGSDTLTITAIGTTAGYANGDPTPLQILPGGQATLTVGFTPIADGTVTGTLTIISDDANSPTTVSLSGTGVSPTLATDGQVPFGNQRVGTTSAGKTLLITNGGSDTLTITAINVGAPFANLDTLPLTIGPNSSANLTFTFAPSVSGSAFLLGSIVSDAANAPVVNIALTGTGVEPVVSLQDTPIFFGNRRVGTTTSRFFTLANSGNTDLVVTALSIPAPFSVVGATAFTLAPAVPRVIEIQFSPTAVGPATESLTITSDASTSPDTFTVSGAGTVPGLTPSTTSLAFGTVKTGTQSAAQTFTLTNTGDAPTSITTTNVPAGFALAGPPLPVSLLPDGQVTFSVTFNPATNGAASGDITFTSDAPLVPTIAVGGTGGTPMVNPSPASVSFGIVAVGTTSDAQTITLSNVTDLPLVISDIVAAAPFVRSSLVVPVTVPAGGQLEVGVLFSPTQSGPQSGALMVNSDAGAIAIPLDGEGLDPDAPPGTGGCCSTGSDGGSAFVFALLFLPLLRRRRR